MLCGNKAVFGGKKHQDRSTCYPAELERLKALEAWWHSQASERPAFAPRALAPDTSITSNTSSTSISPSLAPPPGPGKTKTLSQVSAGMFFNATVKIVLAQKNNGGKVKWELYVTDGTVSPHLTRNFRNVDIGIPQGGVMCLNVFDNVNPQSETLFQTGAVLHFPNILAKPYDRELELKWSDMVTDDQARSGYQDKEAFLVKNDDPRAIAIEE